MKPAPTIAALSLCALCLAGPASAGGLELADCQLDGPFGLNHVKARCGNLAVPENPAAPDGRRIELNIAVVPATSPNAAPDPVVLLAGGPGQAATEAYAGLPGAFKGLNEHHDILLVDQRGTGSSHPLDCPLSPEEMWAPKMDAQDAREHTRQCLDGLKDSDPRFYTTPIAMDDLERVRQALGYGPMDLVGVSYGTRAAQVFLRRHPDSVRSVVLAGVVPMQAALGLDHARHLDDDLDRIFRRCADSDACSRAFPHPRSDMLSLLQQLGEAPVQVAFAHPRTGEWMEVPFSRDALGGAIRLLAYVPEGQALLPLLLSDAHSSGRLDKLAAQALMVSESLMDQISRGMELSVMCAEDVPFFPADWRSGKDSVIGDELVQYSRAACQVWPRGEIPEDYHEPVQSDKPVLMLTGEYDPVTPADFAEQAKAGLSNVKSLIVPGQGHALLGRGCVDRVIGNFVRDAGFDDLGEDCLKEMGPMPFFIDYTGPTP